MPQGSLDCVKYKVQGLAATMAAKRFTTSRFDNLSYDRHGAAAPSCSSSSIASMATETHPLSKFVKEKSLASLRIRTSTIIYLDIFLLSI